MNETGQTSKTEPVALRPPGDNTVLSGSFSDPGSQNGCGVTINWGDGGLGPPDLTNLTLDPGATSFSTDPHTFPGPGTYTIAVTVSDGTDRSTTATQVIYVPQTVDDSAAPPSGLVSGFSVTPSGTGAWTNQTVAGAVNGEQEWHAESSGSDKAVWTFANLVGTAYYDVYVTWSPTSGASTAAQYRVYNGATLLASPAAVDQQEAPADAQGAGALWHDLGVFQATSGTLNVQLGTDGSGKVLADAVRLVRHDAAPSTNLFMNGFSVDSDGNLCVAYTVSGDDSTPFSVGVYSSPGGGQPATLLQTYAVDDPSLLVAGSHSVSFAADLSGYGGSSSLTAKLDANNEVYQGSPGSDFSNPLSGVFQNSDGSVYVLGTPSADTITISPTAGAPARVTVTLNSTVRTLDAVSALFIAGNGGDDHIDGAGVAVPMMIHGGSGNDTIQGGDQSNFIDGGGTISGGGGQDWLFGAANSQLTGGAGREIIHGAGGDTITGGTGLDDLFGDGSTCNIEGHGTHDLLDQSSDNDPLTLQGGALSSPDVSAYGGLMGAIFTAPDAYQGHFGVIDSAVPWQNGMFDGSTTQLHLSMDSGARLPGADSTQCVVYVHWGANSDVPLGLATQWGTAYYTVSDSQGHTLGSYTVDQDKACAADATQPGSNNTTTIDWQVLLDSSGKPAVFDAQTLLTITISDVDPLHPSDGSHGPVYVDGVMVRPFWPTVTVRTDRIGAGLGNLSEKQGEEDDWYNSWSPNQVPLEGSGQRLAVDLHATVDPVFTNDIPDGWKMMLPNVPGLEFFTTASGGTPMTTVATVNGVDKLIDDAFPVSGTYDRIVYVSVDPNGSLATQAIAGAPATVAIAAEADGPNGACVFMDVPAEATPTHKDVFAFEGYGGFPDGWKQGNNNPPTRGANGDPTTSGFASDSQVVNWWRAAALAAGKNVDWNYYSQDGVSEAEQDIKRLAERSHAGLFDTITILGYSNGGDAALQVASWLLKEGSISVDLVITCDPVPKSLLTAPTHPWTTGGIPMPEVKPKNVTHLYNFYQNLDTNSAPILFPNNRIRGRTITGADSNTLVTANDLARDPRTGTFNQNDRIAKAHTLMPTLKSVTDKITKEIKDLPQSRDSDKFG